METDCGLYTWLTHLSDRGVCVVKNVPQQEGVVTQVCQRIAPVQHSNYGEFFNVRTKPRPINPAYSPIKLNLHMDLIHYENPPGIQVFRTLGQ